MKKNLLLLGLIISSQVQIYSQKIKDYDNNEYNTIKIGTQEWFLENLKVTKLNDGTAISNVTDYSQWITQTVPAYCWYSNDETTYKNLYGSLYNWSVVESNKICPLGWHVPTKTEWTELFTYLGGANVAGGKLKESGTTHWSSPNTDADNSSGFSGLPSGRRFESSGDGFMTINNGGYFWSSSDNYAVRLYYDAAKVNEYDGFPKNSGISIRCLKDATVSNIDNIQNDLIELFPNPVTNELKIKLEKTQDVEISLYNSLGAKILSKKLVSDKSIDVSMLSKGIYVLVISDKSFSIQKKFVKE